MSQMRTMKLTLPIVRCYADPEDEDRFFIEGVASDISDDAREGRMDPEALSKMHDSAMKGSEIIVNIDHSADWPDQIGQVVETRILNTVPDNAAFANAQPPLLWTKMHIDMALSHGKDLYYKLVEKKERLGLSVEGWLKDYTIDKDGMIRRLEVIWTKLSITANPANSNAWISEIAMSVGERQEQDDEMKGGLLQIANYLNLDIDQTASSSGIVLQMQEELSNHGGEEDMTEQYEELAERVDALAEVVQQLVELSQQEPEPEPEPEPTPEPEMPEWATTLANSVQELSSNVAQLSERREERNEEAIDLIQLLRRAVPQRGLNMSATAPTTSRRQQMQEEGTVGDPPFLTLMEQGQTDAARLGFWDSIDRARGLS